MTTAKNNILGNCNRFFSIISLRESSSAGDVFAFIFELAVEAMTTRLMLLWGGWGVGNKIFSLMVFVEDWRGDAFAGRFQGNCAVREINLESKY